MFCTQHVAFHRQELANELDLVIGERNELQDVFDHREELIDVSIQLNLIAEWVKKTVEQVYHVADNVRQTVLHLAEERKTSVKDQFADLSKQLDTLRENENFYEKDIENLKEQCIHLKNCLHPVDINVIVTDPLSFLAQAITLRQTEEKPVETRQLVEPLSFVENLVKHQQPLKKISIPHTGVVHMGSTAALLHSGDNFTIMDFDTDSLQSICMENSRRLIFCYSTYLDGFFCADPDHNSKIVLLKIKGQKLEKTNEFNDTIGPITCMVCFTDRLMLVCYGTERNNGVEEWSVAGQS
jgi:hypothetical protein